MKGFLYVAIVLCILHIFLLIVVAIGSGRGGVMEAYKRKYIGTLIFVHFIVMTLELISYILAILGITFIRQDLSGADTFSSFVAVVCWCSILIFTIVCEIIDWIRHYDKDGKLKYEFYETFLYDETDKKTEKEKRELVKDMRMMANSHWQNVLAKKLESPEDNGSDEKKDALNAVSAIFVDLFMDLDLTKSDVAIGLLLLRWQSDKWIGGHGRVPAEYILEQTDPALKDLAAPLDPKLKNPFDKLEKEWLHISRLRRYSHFVNASYGWVYYYADNPCDCVAINRLCQKLSCSNPTTTRKEVDLENGIHSPGGCCCAGRNLYLAAFIEMAQLEPKDILYFELVNKLYSASIMLVIDDLTEAIVLIVRGTLSGDDVLVDMVGAGEPLRDEDRNLPPKKQMIGHAGMCRTARTIVQHILEQQLFESARRLRPRYPVVICGHSLGAGLVSLMSVLLKPHYPELKAYAFSPPGGLMNKNIAKATRDYLCSVSYGYDCVGRMSSRTIEDLRARIFHALCVYKKPKFLALGKEICRMFLRNLPCCCNLPKIIDLDEETGSKLIDPDMNDAFKTPIGLKFKPYLKDRPAGESKIDRLVPNKRSLMRWKNPQCKTLLILPRPYPRSLYPESLVDPVKVNQYTVDLMIESFLEPIPSGRLLHILEVDQDFQISGIQPYKKRGYIPPPIALWTNEQTFNSLLVHPKMFFNHSPIYVSTALDRLYCGIMHPENVYKIHVNTWHKDPQVVKGVERKLTPEDKERYCRVRKLK
ncbi:Sn1-specific diacylglycerol lipase beta [Echinococcus granulosus]|uniref:sn-1-specific diacylglycerol lipase n=2 Tax=Echinococcus granulosus TaxID=6210 RepID=W6UXA2_ECHGR|nr:Sn1-specific diacylglycerol lipase beta [Echinococcus granulosus]EUB63167.1 Sn1-specific diacylglycerol lipase beta [Echinococcus granulosus]